MAEIELPSRSGDTAVHFFPSFLVRQTRVEPVNTVSESWGSMVT